VNIIAKLIPPPMMTGMAIGVCGIIGINANIDKAAMTENCTG
jgi:hypothetical protein